MLSVESVRPLVPTRRRGGWQRFTDWSRVGRVIGGGARAPAAAGREPVGPADRAEAERAELALLQEFLPEQLSEAELEELARTAITES
ncbi:MAG: GatB/YqeY domain-containing protein, partial [Alphaproteobacteria bacterium]|nr:GatB/YqeY domain-containing protein [Alphaproteobacteria bacterium]